MSPRNCGISFVSEEDSLLPDAEPTEVTAAITAEQITSKQPPGIIIWKNVVWYISMHLIAVYGTYCFLHAGLTSLILNMVWYFLGAVGITAGAHRLWAHRSYHARLPFRFFLMLCNCVAGQNDIITWSRDHRAHHKYSETDADPHNAVRGFFFSHMGWLLVKKHPDVLAKGPKIDMSDLHADPICKFQRKVYMPLFFSLCLGVPSYLLVTWCELSVLQAISISFARYLASLHATWLVNSAAHMWGNRPYDQGINPAENILVTFGAIGEGFHNYHHTFPHDYSTSELGSTLNVTTAFLDFMAYIGQVTHRKKVSRQAVDSRKQRTGDGTHTWGHILHQHDQ